MYGIRDNETLGIRLGNFPNANKYKRPYGCGLSIRGSQLIRFLKVETVQSEHSEKYTSLKNGQDFCKTMKIFSDGQANGFKMYKEGKEIKSHNPSSPYIGQIRNMKSRNALGWYPVELGDILGAGKLI